jgi:hypothetical protein
MKPDFHLFFFSFKASFCKQSVGFGEQRSKRRARAENVVKEASNILKFLLTARLARRSTHSMKIINVEDSWVLLGVFKHQHLFSCKRDLRTPARVAL